MRAHATLICTLSAVVLLAAQGSAHGQTTSFQAGVSPLGDGSAFEMGARFSPRGPMGVDVSIDVYPEYIAEGALLGVADISLAATARLGPIAIEPRVGVSIFGVVGTFGIGEADGVSGGVGLVCSLDSRTALRVDYTYRRVVTEHETYPFPSLTAGFLIHH